ncbi:MAG: PAS domain-containing protein [Acidobacteriota bacterium]|nr:PAS domain-containing protein [Acidobacteriota bacterium]
MSELFKSNLPASQKDSQFRRRVLGVIVFLALALVATHTFLHRTSVGSHRFIRMTFLVYTGTFLAVLALLVLATILGRNLIKLYFEKKSGKPGSGLKTKLVRSFIGLSLLPALLLFVFAYTIISSSIEKWFLAPPTQILEDGRMLARQYDAGPEERKYWADRMAEAADKYEQLREEQTSLRFNMLLMLALGTLLITFAFAWFALYLSKRITVPMEALIAGAAAVAGGNLSHRVRCKAFDELDSLVDSFNRMTADLEENERRIAAARESLQQTSAENAARRRYIETILQTISTGVVALEADGGIRAMNRAATRMLGVRGFDGEANAPAQVPPKLEDVVDAAARDAMTRLMNKALVLGTISRNLELTFPGRIVQLAVTMTPLADEEGRRTGWVIVLEDMTELLRMEKAAAWQEVARRLAHEIKNPLTPIRLSAERVLNRYRQIPANLRSGAADAHWEDFERFGRLLAECVQTILQEADSLKNLVDEFSRFSRLPETRVQDADLNGLVENVLQLYEGRASDIQIVKDLDAELPKLRLDPEQMKRVFINLFDNAVEAMSTSPAAARGADGVGRKTLRVLTFLDKIQGAARVEVSDTGRGFPEEYHDSMFLPYFSTRKGGTGLGLAIVQQIISDHHGSVRAEANSPTGARIVIDLPLPPSIPEGFETK